MSGEPSERIINMAQILKADINFWRRDIAQSKVDDKENEAMKADLDSEKQRTLKTVSCLTNADK